MDSQCTTDETHTTTNNSTIISSSTSNNNDNGSKVDSFDKKSEGDMELRKEQQSKDPRFQHISYGKDMSKGRKKYRIKLKNVRFNYDEHSVGPKPLTTLLVSNLSPLTTETQIATYLSVYGQVELVEIEKNPSTGGSLGIAIVGFGGDESHAAATLAIEKGHRRKMGQSNSVKIEFDPNGEKLKMAVAETLRNDTIPPSLEEPPRRPASVQNNIGIDDSASASLPPPPPNRSHNSSSYREEGEVVDEELGKWSSIGYDEKNSNNNRYRHSRDYMDSRRYYDDNRYRGYSNRSPPPYDYHPRHLPPPPSHHHHHHPSYHHSSSNKYYSRYSSKQYDMDRYELSSPRSSSYGHLPPPTSLPPSSSGSVSSQPSSLQIKTSLPTSSSSALKWDQPPTSASSSIYDSKYRSRSRSRSRSHTRSHSQSRSRSRSRSIGRDSSSYYGNGDYPSSRSRWDYESSNSNGRDNWDYRRKRSWYSARDDYRRSREDYRPMYPEKLPTILISRKHLPFMRGVLEELRKCFYHYNYLDIYHDAEDWYIIFDLLSDAKRAMAMDRRYIFGYVLYLELKDGTPSDDSRSISNYHEEHSSEINKMDTSSIKTTEEVTHQTNGTEIIPSSSSSSIGLKIVKEENKNEENNIQSSLPSSSSPPLISNTIEPVKDNNTNTNNNNNNDNNTNLLDKQNYINNNLNINDNNDITTTTTTNNNNKNTTTITTNTSSLSSLENSQALDSNNEIKNEDSINNNDKSHIASKPESNIMKQTSSSSSSSTKATIVTTNIISSLTPKEDEIIKHAKQILFNQLADVFLKDVKNRIIGPSIYDFLNPALYKKKSTTKHDQPQHEDNINNSQVTNAKESTLSIHSNDHPHPVQTPSTDMKKNKENNNEYSSSTSITTTHHQIEPTVDKTNKFDNDSNSKSASIGLYDNDNNNSIDSIDKSNKNNDHHRTDMLYSLPKSTQSIVENTLPSFNKLPRFKKRKVSTTSSPPPTTKTSKFDHHHQQQQQQKPSFVKGSTSKYKFLSSKGRRIYSDDEEIDDFPTLKEKRNTYENDIDNDDDNEEEDDDDGFYNDGHDNNNNLSSSIKHKSIDALKKNSIVNKTSLSSSSLDKSKLEEEKFISNKVNNNNDHNTPQEETFFSSSEEGEYQSGASVHSSDNENNNDHDEFDKLAYKQSSTLSSNSETSLLVTSTTTSSTLMKSSTTNTKSTLGKSSHHHHTSSMLERRKPRRLRDYLSDEEDEFDHQHEAFLRQLHQDDEENEENANDNNNNSNNNLNNSTNGDHHNHLSFPKKKKRLFTKKDRYNDDTYSTTSDDDNELDGSHHSSFTKSLYKKTQQQQQGKGKKIPLDASTTITTTSREATPTRGNDIFEEISGDEYLERKNPSFYLSKSMSGGGSSGGSDNNDKLKKRKRNSLLLQQKQKYSKLNNRGHEGEDEGEFMDLDDHHSSLLNIKQEKISDDDDHHHNDYLTSIKNEKLNSNSPQESNEPILDQEAYEKMLLEPDSSDDDDDDDSIIKKEEDKEKHLLELHPDWDPFSQAKDVEDFDFLRLAMMEKLGILTDEEINKRKVIPFTEKENGGCARSRGYYVIPDAEKATYLPKNKAVLDVSTLTTRLSSRTNRVNNRRFVAGMFMQKKSMADSDILKFNQLKGRKKQLRFAKSPIHDWGLYAEERIDANDMVIEYVGEVIRQQVAEEREKKYERCGIGSSYLFRVDDDIVIDATQKGSIARFINHCCTPNCSAKIITVDKHKKIVIYANRDIEPGEEITYDYKFPIEADKIPCLCGSKFCKGTLN
ncbi:unnamed protein product [Cunninghamella blakesleeana]